MLPFFLPNIPPGKCGSLLAIAEYQPAMLPAANCSMATAALALLLASSAPMAALAITVFWGGYTAGHGLRAGRGGNRLKRHIVAGQRHLSVTVGSLWRHECQIVGDLSEPTFNTFLTVTQDRGASAPAKTHLPQIKGSQPSAAPTGSNKPSHNAAPSAPESVPAQSTSPNKSPPPSSASRYSDNSSAHTTAPGTSLPKPPSPK